MNENTYTHTVPVDYSDVMRLRNYLVGIFPLLETASAVKKAIKQKRIQLDGDEGNTGDWILPGMVITYRAFRFVTVAGKFDIPIVFQDDHLLILNKPPGVVTSSVNSRSLQTELKKIDPSQAADALPYPYLVHRLDRQTSGLIIAARTMACRRMLGEMLEQHAVCKEYIALVEGDARDIPILIENDLDGKSAKTEIVKVDIANTRDITSIVRIKLHTGRTHQIRIHLTAAGHPIIGDQLHNIGGLDFKQGLFLMCSHLSFVHPITQSEVSTRADLHKKFIKYIKKV